MMARLKCSECGALAHVSIKGKTYCLKCAPNPKESERSKPPVIIEETPIHEMVIEQITSPIKTKKKPWWKRILGI